jgi:hypothetical protein
MNNSEIAIEVSVIINSKLGELRDDTERDIDSIEEWINGIMLQTEEAVRNTDCRCEICLSKEDWSNLEGHHIAGRKHDPRTVLACIKCHRILSDKQKVWDRQWLITNQSSSKRNGFFLLGLYDLLVLKAEKTSNNLYNLLAMKLIETISLLLR